jgi:hypothetical protein
MRATGRDQRTSERIVIEIMGSLCKPTDLTAVRIAARLLQHVEEALHKRGGGTPPRRGPLR